MKTFSTYGPVNPKDHYVVSRTEELADFIKRVKLGRYIVIFAPRQTGKTTFFQWALDALATDTSETYFPIELNFEVYEDYTASNFYPSLYKRIYEEIARVFQRRGSVPSEALSQFLEDTKLTDHVTMLEFFQEFVTFLGDEKLVLIIDEFDGIPQDALRGFLRSLRSIYVHRSMRKCPYSVGIVGVKNVTQLNLDRDFIARAGFRIPLVPDTPKEFVGQSLLYAYLDQFVQLIHGHIYLEGQTGRGKIDLAIFHNAKKYIVETKIWEAPRSYQAGKKQLAAYLKLEGVNEGYYVVFDHRAEPEPRAETETIDSLKIRSYVIPVVQEVPSQQP